MTLFNEEWFSKEEGKYVINHDDVKESLNRVIKRLKEKIGDNRDKDGIGYYTYDFIHSIIDKITKEEWGELI